MAPEQWLNAPFDRRLDLYALGATGHLLVTGGYPFPGQTMEELKAGHLFANYSPPASRDPRAAYLFSVISRMLMKDPTKRHPTAAAVADDLAIIAQPAPRFSRIGGGTFRVGAITLRLTLGDMLKMEADVIVNAANTQMTMKEGLAAALLEAGGGEIESEAVSHAPAAMGDVVWTGAGKLRAKAVAHAVAALGGAICLQRCTLRILLEAEARRMKSVAFPALGTGVGRVPMEMAAQLMLEAIRTFAELNPVSVQNVEIVLRDTPAFLCWFEIINALN
jgi:serine/threonine-protein kinase